GNTDNGPQVYWDYSSVGNYNVTLTVTNGCGVDTVITEVVNVNNTTPVINPYIWEVDTVCPGQDFNIQATSDNGTLYEWDFNDGNPPVQGSNINYNLP